MRDHPRSRGVYLGPLRARFALVGSSPLARGLRERRDRRAEDQRIIPARAGFTVRRGQAGRPARIIPARAGFTGRGAFQEPKHMDHPRSRGVYGYEVGSLSRSHGSSPLARGLLSVRWCTGRGGGIIPARAGFTTSGFLLQCAAADHPRSRGVYNMNLDGLPHYPGSSPLARGLLSLPRRIRGFARIIPARAGFTLPVAVRGGGGADHPRSRGVYMRRRRSSSTAAGSSPLARGLPPTARYS